MDTVSQAGTFSGWWHAIPLPEQLFFSVALLAGLVILILGLIATFGIEFHDADVDMADGDSDISGNSLFSIKSIAGAFFAFGWAGGAAMDFGLPLGIALLIAFVAGFLAMLFVAFILRLSRHLRANGNIQKSQAVGKVATVYVTVPPAGQGAGQATVPLDGRTITMGAVQTGDVSLPAGAKVKVIELIDANTVRIQPLS